MILESSEKMGSNLPNTYSCEDFSLMTQDFNLESLNTVGT